MQCLGHKRTRKQQQTEARRAANDHRGVRNCLPAPGRRSKGRNQARTHSTLNRKAHCRYRNCHVDFKAVPLFCACTVWFRAPCLFKRTMVNILAQPATAVFRSTCHFLRYFIKIKCHESLSTRFIFSYSSSAKH